MDERHELLDRWVGGDNARYWLTHPFGVSIDGVAYLASTGGHVVVRQRVATLSAAALDVPEPEYQRPPVENLGWPASLEDAAWWPLAKPAGLPDDVYVVPEDEDALAVFVCREVIWCARDAVTEEGAMRWVQLGPRYARDVIRHGGRAACSDRANSPVYVRFDDATDALVMPMSRSGFRVFQRPWFTSFSGSRDDRLWLIDPAGGWLQGEPAFEYAKRLEVPRGD